VCHPFAPWSIGQVFVEGALRCGASVFPLGLQAGERTIQTLALEELQPTYICGAARNLIRWGLEMGVPDALRSPVRKVFVAGERLLPEMRAKCGELWGAEVVDIYGMAEFDMLGAEVPGVDGICLIPTMTYGLVTCPGGMPSTRLEPGLEGILSVHPHADSKWHETGDRVRLCGAIHLSSPPWGEVQVVKLLGREDESAILADGSLLLGIHVDELVDRLKGVAAAQVRVTHRLDGDEIRILCVCGDAERPDPKLVVDLFLEANIDVSDSVRHGAVKTLEVAFVAPDELLTTARGKVRKVVEG
jgi:phenylacetate-coenzyme A ligase PaaK-like adenylate-forming protein